MLLPDIFNSISDIFLSKERIFPNRFVAKFMVFHLLACRKAENKQKK